MSAREWVIRKGGYYYRPNRAGYTAEECAAGRYTEAEAKAEARIEPERMFALHLPWKPCNPAAQAELDTLRARVERLEGALGELIGPYTGGADHALDDPYVVERARAALEDRNDD